VADADVAVLACQGRGLLLRRFCALVVLSACVSIQLIYPVAASAPKVARVAQGIQEWSDPATWGGSLPGSGDDVRIPSGTTVLLDTDTPSLGGLQIDGALEFAEKKLSLTADWIMIHGALRVGSETQPFRNRAVITLTGTKGSEDVMDMGTRFMGVMGGTLELHGRRIKGWTRLTSTVQRGDSSLQLEHKKGWKRGDRIVIASSSYWSQHDEVRTITAVTPTTVELDRPLERMHWGEVQSFAGRTVDERAEVGLLSRNIVIRGAEAGSDGGFGSHLMVMEGGEARIDGVEFNNVGQRNILRRYPVHFHMDGRAPESYLKRSSIHNSSNRCVTVHGTSGLRIQNNVCFDHVGHGFFLEDGAETDNIISGNLGLGTRSVDEGLLPSDRRAATFWITNPDNVVRNNVAAGSEGIGFWYALPEHPTGLSESDSIWPRRTPLGAFDGNVAHSNGDVGLNVDHGPRPNGHTEATWYAPVVDPSDEDSDPVVADFSDLTAYYNRDRGVWLRGSDHVVSGAVLADNRSGATFASSDSWLVDSLVVGETANPGTVEDWEDTGPGGRALPFFWEPETPIVGFEFYDGKVGARSTTFVNFSSNTLRRSGGLGYLTPDAFSIHPRNAAEDVTFVDSNEVYLASPEPGMDGDLSKVFVDVDGSVTGTPGSAVVVDNPFLLTNRCSYRAAWNAHVCPEDYVSLYVIAPSPNDIKPLTLTRSDGEEQILNGCCDDSDGAVTSILSNSVYSVAFNGQVPARSRYVLYNGKGRWTTLKIEIGTNFEVTRWGWPLDEAGSLAGLTSADDSAYHYDPATRTLSIRLLGHGDWEEVRVERG
jgi:hypothetical protein